jgi:hypothetical protein
LLKTGVSIRVCWWLRPCRAKMWELNVEYIESYRILIEHRINHSPVSLSPPYSGNWNASQKV